MASSFFLSEKSNMSYGSYNIDEEFLFVTFVIGKSRIEKLLSVVLFWIKRSSTPGAVSVSTLALEFRSMIGLFEKWNHQSENRFSDLMGIYSVEWTDLCQLKNYRISDGTDGVFSSVTFKMDNPRSGRIGWVKLPLSKSWIAALVSGRTSAVECCSTTKLLKKIDHETIFDFVYMKYYRMSSGVNGADGTLRLIASELDGADSDVLAPASSLNVGSTS